MPAVIPAHIALRDQLRASVHDALRLNGQLEAVIAVRTQRPGGFHGKVDHSQPPWSAPVANAILDLHAMSREMEAWLRLSQGLRPRLRGGSSESTRRALENVVRLAEAAQDATVKGHTRELRRWGWQADIALGKTERPARLPREKGQPARLCPWCKQDTLRMLSLKGIIRCIDKICKDDQDKRPEGVMTFSKIAGDWIVVWQDGLAGLP
jgi:hypothetical protein